MAMTLRTGRVVKYGIIILLTWLVFNFFRIAWHQTNFQKYLTSQYINWNDFPSIYAETLHNKEWAALEIDAFDYKEIFPRPADHGQKHIPPIIHFIWFQNLYETRPEITVIPSIGSASPMLCGSRNPGWTVNIWNATAARDLIAEHYAWFLPTYDTYPHPIQRVDAFKYFVLWHYGGVYSDLDVECRRPLDPLLPFPAWFPEASPIGVNNDLMASRARHPVIKLMIDNLSARNKNLIFPYLTIFWSTGPQFTGDILKRWWLTHGAPERGLATSKTEADPDEWFVLPQEFYSEEFTFFGHSPGGTWHEGDVAVVLWFVAHPVVFWLLVFGALGGIFAVFTGRLNLRGGKPPAARPGDV